MVAGTRLTPVDSHHYCVLGKVAETKRFVFLEVSMNAHLANELTLDAGFTDPEMCSETLALVVKHGNNGTCT